MNTGSDELFLLIKSLSKSEKRFFKLSSALYNKTDKNYIKLFDAVDEQKVYDEQKIKEKLKAESFIKNLAFEKNHLYKHLLKSLGLYHEKKSLNSNLNQNILHVEILTEKGLHDNAIKIIRKSKQLAANYEKRWHYIYFSLLEISWHVTEEKPEKEIKNLLDKFLNEIDIYKNQQEYYQLQTLIHTKSIKGKNNAFKKEIKEIINHPLFSSEKKALSFSAKTQFLHAHLHYYDRMEDYASGYRYNKQLIALMESNPYSIEVSEANYGKYLYDNIGFEIKLGLFKDTFKTIEKIRKIKFESPKNHFTFNCMVNNSELATNINTGDLDTALGLIKKHEATLSGAMEFLRKQTIMLFYANCAKIYLITGNYSAANKYINKIMNDVSFNNLRADIQCANRILKLIIYFEEGDISLLEHAVKSYRRFFEKWEFLTPVYQILLNFFSKTNPKITSRGELAKAFKNLKSQLQLVEKKSDDKKHYNFSFISERVYTFDFISWVDSKIENRSFAIVVKEKAKSF